MASCSPKKYTLSISANFSLSAAPQEARRRSACHCICVSPISGPCIVSLPFRRSTLTAHSLTSGPGGLVTQAFRLAARDTYRHYLPSCAASISSWRHRFRILTTPHALRVSPGSKMLQSGTTASSLQKIYEEGYLTCSTAVYYEGQVCVSLAVFPAVSFQPPSSRLCNPLGCIIAALRAHPRSSP